MPKYSALQHSSRYVVETALPKISNIVLNCHSGSTSHLYETLITTRSAEYGDNVMLALTFPSEFRNLQAHYPIVFRKNAHGQSEPVALLDFIATLEDCLGMKARKNLLPLQPGDVPDTYADVTALVEDVGYRPGTPIRQGIENFVAWYKEYYEIP